MGSDFYTAAVPEPAVVLGLPLRPLSIGHIILLHRIESAFMVPGAEVANIWSELAMAVAICSQTYAEALKTLQDAKGTQKAMRLWAKKITRTTWRDKILLKKPLPINIASESAAFENYIKDHSKVPHYSYSSDDMREVSCPHVQIVKASLQRAFGIGDDIIMDRSWAVSLWDYVTLKALDGHIEMTDRNVIKEAQEVGERLAKAMAERKANGTS